MPDQEPDAATDSEANARDATRALDTEVIASSESPRRPVTGGRRGAWALATLALVLAVAGWIAGYLAWQSLTRNKATIETAHAGFTVRLDGHDRGLQGGQRRADALEQRVAAQAAALQQQRQASEQTYEALRKQIGQDRNRWIVAETEYLMRVANNRLQLARDLGAATAALRAADQRLSELADPSLLGVRSVLSDEIAALRAVPKVDIEGLALTLGSLAKRVETLPVLGARYRPAAPTATATATGPLDAARHAESLKEVASAVWSEVKGLVEIRRNDTPVKPMLAPELEYFLYQNLRLQLDAARLALLRGEAPLYGESLRAARDWAGSYFEQQAPSTQALIAELERLAKVEIVPALPDISGSLRALRAAPAYRAAQGGEGAS